MIRQNKRAFIQSLGALIFGALLPGKLLAGTVAPSAHHLVVLGDLHLPGNNLAIKENVLQTLNQWNDVEAVVAVGDLCESDGSAGEYRMIRAFFEKLKKPLLPIAGNHDFIYSWAKKGTKSVRGDAENREEKLRRFRDTFGLSEVPSVFRLPKGGFHATSFS